MVFESLVADLLNRFLGDFVDNLDSSQLNIGIWGGDVKLENLEIKESALDDLDLPVKLKFGYIESLVLKIPWKNLYTEPVIATVDGVQLIVVPNKGVVYNEEKAKKNAKEIKEKTLTRLEEARKNRRKPPDPQADSFAEKMVAQVIKNLQVAVHNAHVRFEDKYTNRARPFAAGVTLASLQLHTTDSNWKSTVHKDVVKIVHKLVDLNNLAVYWDSDVKLISDLEDKMVIRQKLRDLIAKGDKRPQTKYILDPIKMQAKLSLNQKPETDESNWKIPKIDLVVDMEQLTMAIGKMQYQDLLLFLEAQERFGLATQYLRHRPNLNVYKGHYKEWWKFAYNSILHEKVKRRRQNWSWARMKEHRDLVKAYTEAWVSKQTEKSPAADVTKTITAGEEGLDVFSVNVARQQAEMEIDRRGLTRLDDQPQGWGAWAKSWWGSGAAEPAKAPPGKGGDIAAKFQAAMTPEEKAKLFEAIDYQENIPPTNYPKEFIENRIDFKLGQVNIIVEGAIQMDFVGLHAALQQRPSAGAINLKARISEVRMDGCKEAMLRMREKGDWLTVEVDTNPLAGGYDQKVALRIAPVNFIYAAAAVNKAIDVFKPPESVKLNQLTAAAMSRYEEVKTRSALGMQHALEKKTKLVLDMVIQPATIYICDGGTFNEFKPVLLADLGLLTITTVDVDETKMADKMERLTAKAYDRFRVELSNVVVVLAENVADAESARTAPSSPLHLLRPTGLDIQIHKCGIDDLKLAKLRVLGNLPDVVIGISDDHLIMLLKLLLSIPKPPADPVTAKEEELVAAPKLKDRAKMKTIMEDEVELSVEPTEEPKDVLAKNNQQVQIELQLQLNEIGLIVSRGSSTLVALSVLGMKCKLQMRTHDMVVKAQMGALRVHMPTHKSLSPGRDHLYLVDNLDQDGPLLSVDVVQAQTESPFFATEYKNTEQLITLNFTQLIVSLHQEGLIELKKYGEEVQSKVNEIVGKKEEDTEVEGTEETVTDAVGKKLSQVVAHSMESLSNLRRDRKKSSRKDTISSADAEVDKIINMKVDARFGSLSVFLGTEKALESVLAIEDISASVKMMKAQMDVSATLKAISVTDSAKEALYKKLMHVQGSQDVMLRFEMTQFNREEKMKRPTDIDMKVKLRLARLRFVFVNLWVSRVLAWLQPFQAQAAAAAAAASTAATAKAQQAAHDVKAAIAERQPRIELDILLEAPIIVVPRLSTSTDVIVVDLGSLSVNNSIVAEKAGTGIVVVDVMEVRLKDMNVGIASMEKSGSTISSRRHILSPLTFTVQLSRNLMWEESKAKPQAAVDMHLSVVEAKLSQKDYSTIMATLSGNLAEKVEPDDTLEVFTPPSTRTPPVEDSKKDSEKKDVEKQHPGDRIADASKDEKSVAASTDVQFDVKLVVDEIKAVLNADDDSGIATLSIRGFKTNAKVMGDNAIDVALNLAAFTMYDERPETQIRELMEKRGHKDQDLIKMHFAQNAQQDKKVQLAMCAFFICLCPEFLGSLAKFFAVEKTEEEKEREAAELERKLAAGTVTAAAAGGGAAGTAAGQPAAPVQGTLALDADIKGIEVIVVEDSTQPASSQALILTFNCNIKSHPTADAEEMAGGIEGLHIYSSYYDVTKRDQVTYEVLKKADIKLTLRSEKKSKAMDIKVHSTPLELYMAPSIIRLLSAVNTQFAAASQEESAISTSAPRVRRFANYWSVKPLNETNHWFLKAPMAEEAVEEAEEALSPTGPVERAEVKFPVISLTLETDDNGVRTPLILLGMSMELSASNWSWALKADGDMAMQMNYFNEAISVWEPVIEPCEVEDGVYETWAMQLSVIGRNKLDALDKNPDMSVKIETDRMLNITFTKSLYELTNKLSDAFTRAAKQIAPPTGTQLPGDEPFLVLNDTGVTVMIHNSNTLQVSSDDRPIDATHGDYVRLKLREEAASGVGSAAAAARDPFGPPVQQETKIDMIMETLGEKQTVRVGRAGRQILEFNPSNKENGSGEEVMVTGGTTAWKIVAETRVEGGRRLLTLSSHIRVQSHIETDIEVFTRRDTTLDPAGSVSFGEKMNMPINLLYGNEGEIFFKPTADKWSVCETGIRWHEFTSSYHRMIECRSVENPSEAFHFEVTITEERCSYGHDSVHAYVIHFHPPLVLQNLLPMVINVKKPMDLELEPGDHSVLNVVPGEVLKLSVVHLGETYWLDMPQYADKPDLEVVALNLETGADELLLGIRWSREAGGLRGSLYAPFWLVNNTQHILNHLECSTGFLEASTTRCVPCKKRNTGAEMDSSIVHKPDHNPIILPFPSVDLAQKKKAQVKVGDSNWSDSFPLDTAGNASRITCKGVDRELDLTVDIRLCSSGLTKVVTYSPFYLVSNCGRLDMEVREDVSKEWITVPAATCIGLYPQQKEKRKLLCVRYAGSKEESLLFPITENLDTFAHINDDTCGVSVSVTVAESSVVVHLTPFAPGMAPAHVINHSPHILRFWQKGGHKEVELKPRESAMFTWADVTKNRVLEYACIDAKGEDTLDQSKMIQVQPDNNKPRYIYFVSFLNGRQRTLLFESDLSQATEAHGSWERDKITMVSEVKLYGVGISVVDNIARKEILYMAISSSAVLWEEEAKKGRFKAYNVALIETLEGKYGEYLENPEGGEQWIPVSELFSVDFKNMIIRKKKNKEVKLRRCFEKGIWASFGQSKERQKVHLKLNHIQIDNQLDACVFPCMLAAVPPPRSIVQDNAPKPFIELSMVKRQSEHSSVPEIEYLKVLMQEFAVRVDQGAINALLQFIATEAEVKQYDREAFAADFKMTETKLEDLAQSWKVQKPKSFYQLLHISPLMIHLSFSQGGTTADSSDAPIPIQSQFISILLKSVGVTLTELQDVVFKLAYFERKCVFYSSDQLNGEIISHYTKQAIKQLYVLVLGLDIIGNPFGLVRDLSSGVEDLFYQPFQGAIQGPEEFVSGMALGVQSLVGHTIGGAAGAVGRIAGTVGKGVAALTFDDDYQRRRQEDLNRKPASGFEGMARGMKGLGMGIVDGVTGVVTKPIDGARQGGAGGFVKGLGKGLVGVVARPVSGAVDFASSTLHTVKTVAGTDRSTDPLRAPRLIRSDGIVRPYSGSEAIGHKIFKDTDRGAVKEAGDHFIAHASISDKCVLLVTDKHLIISKRTDMMGTWSTDWSTEYGKIHEPTFVENGIKIVLKEKKKGFLGIGGTQGKIITFNNGNYQIIRSKILETYRAAVDQ
ncbi:hypothetical protein PFISCL1PPCAC_20422 [Pristionchus fissidentatus]|uniref:Uncharacterized protein n=1 Tax=Pristionchus fissidentatus TaxID=1538716 RepID=A0AAV5WES2_9BILA|nr:hypothetical protein PFISCL1PPCAC_20422 [Pristionchus fissidentatus]